MLLKLTLVVVELIIVISVKLVVNLDNVGIRRITLESVSSAIKAQNELLDLFLGPGLGSRRRHGGKVGVRT